MIRGYGGLSKYGMIFQFTLVQSPTTSCLSFSTFPLTVSLVSNLFLFLLNQNTPSRFMLLKENFDQGTLLFNHLEWLPICLLDKEQIPRQGSRLPIILLFKLYFPLLPPHFLCFGQFPDMLLGAEADLFYSLHPAHLQCSPDIISAQNNY